MRRLGLAMIVAALVAGCGEAEPLSGLDGAALDADWIDAGDLDAGDLDAGDLDAGDLDAGDLDAGAGWHDAGDLDAGDLDAGWLDGGSMDAGPIDGGSIDGGSIDAGADASFDAGLDAFVSTDAGLDAPVAIDAGRDAGGGGCISGASGTHAVRFRWAGSGSGSTAYVVYEANQLPDTSRWRVTAASMSTGYRPVFSDIYLGEGGLELSGTAFIDVELSTAGLGSIRNVTIAVYGRSYATTTSGSFSWQTFDGVGATPSNSVANSAPYEWYPGDATAAFRPGNSGALLRLRAGPSSNALVVNRVEICFDAS